MRSVLPLPPALQAVWTAVYNHVLTERSRLSGQYAIGELSRESASVEAWEAVRRANGGEMPGEHMVVDKALGRLTMREALLWFADEGHYAGLPRHQTGIERAREALGIPCRHEDGSLMPLEEALTHSVTIGADVDEPTDEEMVEALAPIVAASIGLSSLPERDQVARQALRGKGPHVTWVEIELAQRLTSGWKAARAWRRK